MANKPRVRAIDIHKKIDSIIEGSLHRHTAGECMWPWDTNTTMLINSSRDLLDYYHKLSKKRKKLFLHSVIYRAVGQSLKELNKCPRR